MARIKIILLLFIFTSLAKAQTTYLMSNTNVTLSCASVNLFYDSGGSASDYSNGENLTKTFTAPPGFCLNFEFGSFSTQNCCDHLYIYDGPTVASPLIGMYNGPNDGPTGIVNASNNSITFSFTSNGNNTNPGWTATITCQPTCVGAVAGGTTTNFSQICASTGSVQLSVNGSPVGCGLAYQWQSGPSAAGPWTNVAGAVTASITIPIAAGTFYRRITSCGASTGTSIATSASGSIITTCDLSNYVPSATPYNFDVFAGTVLPTTDDVLFTTIINFGFPFCYSGSQYWGGYVASNCAFVFDAVPCFPNINNNTYAAGGVATGYIINSAAPINNTSIPRNAILAPWQDTHPGLGGTIRYATLGTAPNRRFVASWEGIPMYSCGTSSPGIYYTGQVKLFETTNNIEIHVGNKGVCPGFNGGDAIMGLHNYNGTVYIPPVNATAHNYPTNWAMTNTAYRFTATCAAAGGACTTLPINFKKFYGQQMKGVNKLSWETAEEENIKEFSIERSTDAVNFTEIGKALPYNQPSRYDFNDVTFKANIINYYKVTAVENNGSRKSTFIIPIGGVNEDFNVSEIYPNPVKDNFTLAYNSKIETAADVLIRDMYGRLVISSHHTIAVGNSQTVINCQHLNAGVYIVEVKDAATNKIVSQQKLIVVN